MIKQIDIPRYQVQVDAIIVELTQKKAAELGVTWAVNGSDNDRAVGLTNFMQPTGGISNSRHRFVRHIADPT